jgi:hypothetical protein
MATQLKIRRGTTAEHASFTGAEGEITLDTTKDTLVAHDNYTAGGRPMLREDLNNLANASIAVSKIQSGTAKYGLRTNLAGNAVEFFDRYTATLLYSRSPTSAGYTATLSESLLNFRWVTFQSNSWSNIYNIPVSVFSTSGAQHMLDTYASNHSYATYTNATTITATAGTGNTFYKVWGLK